jgi:hypothetical protein
MLVQGRRRRRFAARAEYYPGLAAAPGGSYGFEVLRSFAAVLPGPARPTALTSLATTFEAKHSEPGYFMITKEKHPIRMLFLRDHAERRGGRPMAGRDPPCGAHPARRPPRLAKDSGTEALKACRSRGVEDPGISTCKPEIERCQTDLNAHFFLRAS